MITRQCIQEIQEMVISVLNVTKKKEYSCLYMSALLFAQINDNLPISPKFVAGSLTLRNELIFSHYPILPALRSNLDFSELWNGHAWVEVEDLIFDPSIFFTIYSPSTPKHLQNKFEKTFNGKHDYLIGNRAKLEESGIIYKIYEDLSDDDATVLIRSGFSAGFLDERIC